MSRTLIALVVAATLISGGLSASAETAVASAAPESPPASTVAKNERPLAPGRAQA